MTQGVWNSVKEGAVLDLMFADREELTQKVKIIENVVTGPISSTDLA